MKYIGKATLVVTATFAALGLAASRPASAQQKPNIVMLMTDNTGWNDFGPYSGEGLALGQKPPKVASGSGDGLTA